MLEASGAESHSTGAPFSDIVLSFASAIPKLGVVEFSQAGPCSLLGLSGGVVELGGLEHYPLKAACHLPDLQHLEHAAHGCGRHHRRGLARVALLNCPAASQVRLFWAPRTSQASTFCPGVFGTPGFANSSPWEALQQLPFRREFSWVVTLLPWPLRGPPGLSDGPCP